ncbi:MAG TPA: glycosyltransferase family 39 protein, partial [Dehalococcoidia bacterium]|nr:glycosyltransferase family 39 protein [Dehalococcoidia bacterium]
GLRRHSRALVQTAALAAAVVMGIHGSLIINEPSMRRFDEALVWYGFALLALTVFAWDVKPSLPRDGWRRSFASFWSSHWIEIIVFAVILGFAVFMRAYKLGVFPPKDALAFEETINGSMAYRILHGERPLFYPVRYLDAVGLWLFGDTTFGLRFFGIAMSIATVPVFYLLLRQLVRVPVALFGTALLAAAYWPSLVNRETSATTFFTMLLAYLLIRGLRNHSALMFLGVGFLAGLISYEYEDIKPVPFYVLGFLGAIAVWQIGDAALKGWRPARDATASILRKAWRPALAFAIAGGIVAGPLIVGTHLGKDPYLGSLHRQEADRRNLGTPGLFAPNWEQQVRWSVQLFRPLSPGPPRARLPLNLPDIPVLDPISGILLAAGVVYGAFTFLRPHRLFFLGWFVATLAGGALLLSRWEPWKFYGLLPVGFVLAAFLVNDLYSLWLRLRPKLSVSPVVLPVLALGVMAYVCSWNADTLFGRAANNQRLLNEYGRTQGQWYAMCDYLRSQGHDNFSYAFHSGDTSFGFWRQRDTLRQQMGGWGDWVFVCHDLQGASLSSPQEAWPLRAVPSDKLTLAFLVRPDAVDAVKAAVQRGYPGLTPDDVPEGPAGVYSLLGYSLTDEDVRSRQGLYGEYFGAGASQAVAQRVDKVYSLSWAASDGLPAPPFTVFWRGLVYLADEGHWSLEANSGDPTWISLDGAPPYAAHDDDLGSARLLRAGWHTVEITLQKETPGGSFSLQWLSPDGASRIVAEHDFFALQDLSGWRHTRTFEFASGDEAVRQRIEDHPEMSARNVVEAALSSNPEVRDAKMVRESYSSRWSVDEPITVVFTLTYGSGRAAISVDGTVVGECEAPANRGGECTAQAPMGRGDHFIEIQLSGDETSQWTGATLLVGTSTGPLAEGVVEMRPFPE